MFISKLLSELTLGVAYLSGARLTLALDIVGATGLLMHHELLLLQLQTLQVGATLAWRRLLLELLGELGRLVQGLGLVLRGEVFVLLGHLLGALHSPV